MEDLLFLATPFIIGLLHCIEPDHLIAVSSLVRDKEALLRDMVKGVSWGAGHSVPVLGLGVLYLFFNLTFSKHLNSELPVGLMLIILSLLRLRLILKSNKQKKNPASNFSFLSVGAVHGLAGTVSIVALLSSKQTGAFNQLFFLALFCIGLMSGMSIMTGMLSRILPLISKIKMARAIVPLTSMVYGLVIILQNV
ncbi:MAG: hypothetical protein ACOYXT_14860 [Bacteroidota bacterium]